MRTLNLTQSSLRIGHRDCRKDIFLPGFQDILLSRLEFLEQFLDFIPPFNGSGLGLFATFRFPVGLVRACRLHVRFFPTATFVGASALSCPTSSE